MRGQEDTYGMGDGASVRKGKTAKQVRRARKAIDAQKSKPKPKVSMSSKPDAVDRAGYRAPKATPKMSRRSADSYGSPKLKHVAAPGFSKAIKGIGKVVSNVASNIQNKSGAAKKTNTPTMAQAYKAAAKPKGGSGSKKK